MATRQRLGLGEKARYCSGDNPFRFDLTDKFVMGDTDAVKHCESMPFEQIPAFLAKLRQNPSMGSFCLQFDILTACRPDEARGLRWSELDLKNRLWSPPAHRMKQARPHFVPLSAQVMAILEQRRAAGGEQYPFVFPSKKCSYRKPVSNGSVDCLLPGHKHGKPVLPGSPMTHGFRTSFKTWAKLQRTPEGARLYDFELIEKALSHLVGNKVAQAYDGEDMPETRRPMLQAWADFLGSAPAAAPEPDEHVHEWRLASSPVCSKSDAAAALGLKRSTFSEMLKRGAVGGDALVGEGQKARIKVEVARHQISGRKLVP